METIAVYWEERVKVYGITEKPGLTLATLRIPAEQALAWSGRLADLEDSLPRFELVTGQNEGERMELCLLVESAALGALQDLVRNWLSEDPSAEFTVAGAVDLVFLHGPHFQDRFGIAETAFSALARQGIDIVLSGCAGTSMYLLFAEGHGGTAKEILTDTFLIPTTT